MIYERQYFDPVHFNATDCEDTPPIRPRLSNLDAQDSDTIVLLQGPLSFLHSDWFAILSGMVVVVNTMVLYVDITSKYVGLANLLLNQVCLLFYCVEVLLRILHFGRLFLRVNALWNLIDCVVVFVGVLDQWILTPLLPQFDLGTLSSSGVVPCLRMLNFLRGLRFLKLIKLLLHSDLHWTESTFFETVTSLVICMSIVLMGLETDIQSGFWDPLENMILFYFVFEISVRLRRHRLGFFVSADWAWNWLDFCIVMFGAFDEWLKNFWMQLVARKTSPSSLGEVVLLARTLRLLRILRLVRLVKAVRPLYILAIGVVEAMQSMFWVLVLTLVALYISAILMTRMVGHGELGISEADPANQELFQDVFASMFTLFAIMNGQDWVRVEPLLQECPFLKIVFVVFTIFSSWSLLSVMTGVVSDNMISAREAQNQQEELDDEDRVARFEKVVRIIFVAADPDEMDRIRKDRYDQLLENPYYLAMLQELLPATDIKDLRDLFLWLDSEGNGTVQYQEFLDGLRTLSEPVTGRALLFLDTVVRDRFSELNGAVRPLIGKLDQIGHDAQVFQNQCKLILDKSFGL